MKPFRAFAGAATMTATIFHAGLAFAQAVPTCEALTLYGNAAADGLCKSLSPTTQNLWVCDFTGGSPDIHATFNAATPLHITVRNNPSPPGCQGNSTLTGNAGNLMIAGGQPTSVCNVSIQNYVNRLNAVPATPAGGGSACQAGFLAAQASGKLPVAVAATYLAKCNAPAPAAAACP